ncbi:MAG: hypothetical protein PHS17_15435 [Desulfobacterales bacterium]|nr:hypothetical protein [Desulfobacterales bacterium]
MVKRQYETNIPVGMFIVNYFLDSEVDMIAIIEYWTKKTNPDIGFKMQDTVLGFDVPGRGEICGADRPEYWNVGIVEYWGRTATKSLEMSVPQDGFIALKPIIPSFHYSNIPTFPGNSLLAEPSSLTWPGGQDFHVTLKAGSAASWVVRFNVL